MGFHSRHQLAGAEGFCHIVVGSEAQATDFVDVVFFRGNHDDRRIFMIANLLADLETIHLRQHQIQDKEIVIRLQCAFQSHIPPVLDLHLEAAELQIVFFQVCNGLFILDNQYFTHLL